MTKLRMLTSIIGNPFTMIGSYEKIMVTEDGGCLCSACCKENAADIMSDIESGYSTGWMPAALTYEAVAAEHCDDETKTYCDHCGKEIGEFGC